MTDPSQHTRQANLGMQPVARLARARSSSTTSSLAPHQDRAFLCRHHHARDPLLHGWPRNRCEFCGREQQWNGYPRSVCCCKVAGGVHGNNRLGGNSLQDCVVFSRVAGVHCAKYMRTLLSELSGADVRDAAIVDGGGLAGASNARGVDGPGAAASRTLAL